MTPVVDKESGGYNEGGIVATLDEWVHRHPPVEDLFPHLTGVLCDYRDRRLLRGTDQ